MEEFIQQSDNTRVVTPQERVPILPYDQIQADNKRRYGKTWQYSKENMEAMRKAIPLPGLTIPFIINELQQVSNIKNQENDGSISY